ncbi:hypothetical protein [Microbacterium sp. 3J1]|uniref:hypothetical protein n=1 Tax=Microbacterium sp. 3J1 TaxID=861269 RepID=UPI000A877B20|nr:hypothetical protein [Microbacterium sp. 3J1]
MDRTPLPAFSREYAEATVAGLGDRPRAEAEQHVVECLKTLVLASALPDLPIASSPELDSVWRSLAVQTSSYLELCTRLPGGHLLERDIGGGDPTPDHSARLVALYVQSLGPFTPRSALLWPAARFVMVELRVGLSGLNDAGGGWDAGWTLPPGSPWWRLGEVLRISELV